jgi:two-component sensor histidine kinase
MTADNEDAAKVEQLLDTPNLADAIESDRFKQFLDHVPFAVAVSELLPSERLTYANLEFERLTGTSVSEVQGRPWNALPLDVAATDDGRQLADAVTANEDYLGTFSLRDGDASLTVDAWSSTIEDERGTPLFRLVALAEVSNRISKSEAVLSQQVLESDTHLRELQHRVKNNLQMITALIRLEARNLPPDWSAEPFDRLSGRIESMALLYRALSDEDQTDSIDLGVYLSQIASAVMAAHAVAGIHLNLQVDTWPVSLNVAMPTGLVVNELMTNALKHGFAGRDGGTITVKSLVDDTGCRITVSDDGVGLPEGTVWPQRGKLSAMIVHSLRENAGAQFDISSAPDHGMSVAIFFARANAAPLPTG